jgi:Flp pilus assembly protein TadG
MRDHATSAHPGNRQDRSESGTSTVEIGLLLPVLLLCMLGTVECGNMFASWLTLQRAAQDGARFAATGQGDQEGNRLTRIVNLTKQEFASISSGPVTVTVRSWPGMNVAGSGRTGDPGRPCDTVEVQAQYTYALVTPLLKPVFSDSVVLTGAQRKLNEPWQVCQ